MPAYSPTRSSVMLTEHSRTYHMLSSAAFFLASS
jgi:hypothetical protein